jgi:hypothetical protein
MPKLTKRTVDTTEIRSSDYVVWDDELPGFGLRIFASGKRSYVVQHRAARPLASATRSACTACGR